MKLPSEVQRAAEAVIASRNAPPKRRSQRASIASPVPKESPLSLRNAAAKYGVSMSRVARAVAYLTTPGKPRELRPPGRPRIISENEDAALVAYAVWMQRGGCPATTPQLSAAARELRSREDPLVGPMSKMWARRWLREHPKIQGTHLRQRPSEDISEVDSDVSKAETFFQSMKDLTAAHNLGASECWNQRDCGIRISSLNGRTQAFVTSTAAATRSRKSDVPDFNNINTCSLIGAANAAGDTMPPWVIVRNDATGSWSQTQTDETIHFASWHSGQYNCQTALDWLRHFNAWSWRKSASTRNTGKTLEQWFGCDEWLRDPSDRSVTLAMPPVQRSTEERIYRLLIVDGSPEHTRLDFVQYCIKFDIVMTIIPPASTHVIPQPLDVGVFETLRVPQGRSRQRSSNINNLDLGQVDLISVLQDMFAKGFTASNVISGFEQTGMFPPTSEPAVNRIRGAEQKKRDAANPTYASFVPPELGVIRDAQPQHQDATSSPMGGDLPPADMAEASPASRNQPTEIPRTRLTLDRTTASSRNFFSSFVIKEIQREIAQNIEREVKMQHRLQLQASLRVVEREMDKKTTHWLQDPVNGANGRERQLAFEQWLQHTGSGMKYANLKVNHNVYRTLLAEHDDDGSAIDRGPLPEQMDIENDEDEYDDEDEDEAEDDDEEDADGMLKIL